MQNDRTIHDPKLQEALSAVHETMSKYDLAGSVMLVAEDEVAFTLKLDATWSAVRADPSLPHGLRIVAKSAEDGPDVANARIAGALHTICQLSDFGEMTTAWMTDLKDVLRKAGVEFDHTKFGGQPMPRLGPKG